MKIKPETSFIALLLNSPTSSTKSTLYPVADLLEDPWHPPSLYIYIVLCLYLQQVLVGAVVRGCFNSPELMCSTLRKCLFIYISYIFLIFYPKKFPMGIQTRNNHTYLQQIKPPEHLTSFAIM